MGRPFLIGFICVAVGFSAAQLRTIWVQEPMLQEVLPRQRVEGVVAYVDKKSDRWYVGVEDIISHDFKRIRFTLRGKKQQSIPLHPGDRIRAQVTLMPPSPPPTPEVYNFRRKAFFQGLGAVGYALEPPQVLSSEKGPSKGFSVGLWMRQLRQTITDRLRATVGGEEGAIAAALITGDRSGISLQTREAYAQAGIAHILAISGLHLAIVAGFIFFLLRKGLSLVPAIALRYSTKKIASLLTLILTSFYLSLCWQSLPARRAYIMTSIVMVAILVDRSALSLRNVMFAATLILLALPESLLNPSFQLSFAAVIALIAAYESLQSPLNQWRFEGGIFRHGCVYFLSIVGTTVIATLATTPYSMFTFNQFTVHGIQSNLLAIPITTFFVMPLEVINLCLMGMGLDFLTSALLHKGIYALNAIAYEVSSWKHAAIYLAQSPPWVLGLFTMGGLWICLWQLKWRWLGLVPLLLGIYLLFTPPVTDIYIDRSATLVGIRDRSALYLTSLRRSPFTAHLWQRHGGNLPLKSLKTHPDFRCFRGICRGELKGAPLTIVLPFARRVRCTQKGGLFINLKKGKKCPQVPHTITPKELKAQGGMLIKGEKILTTRTEHGHRPWTVFSE